MEVEQRLVKMQLVRKAAEQYHRLMDCSRPTLSSNKPNSTGAIQQTNRETNNSSANVNQKKSVGVGVKNGPHFRLWQRTSHNGLKVTPATEDISANSKAAASESQKASHKTRSSNNSSNSSSSNNSDMTMLQLLAFNALDLTAPASDVLLKNRRSPWVQLSGHPGSFAPAGPGTLWKKQGVDNNEELVYEALLGDSACDIVPKYYRQVSYQGESFIEMQDLLHGFTDPNVMDIKMGTRTFLESEVTNLTARSDLYDKMVKVEPSAPTKEENELKAVTKLRYMMFREQQSSTCSLGFRIEAIKLQGKPPVNELKTIKTREAVQSTLAIFLNRCPNVKRDLLSRLKYIREKFQDSSFFQTHEVVGSSILIIYDSKHVGAWMIDFAKTLSLPDGVNVTHRKLWQQGNHEEGYLTGIDNLIEAIETLNIDASASPPIAAQSNR